MPPSPVVMFLFGKKLKQPASPRRAARRAVELRAERVRGVLDHEQAVPLGGRASRVHVGRSAAVMEDHDAPSSAR